MRNDSEIFRQILTGFVTEEDPLLSMLKWMMDQLMQIEAEMKVGAKKHEHNRERKSHFGGYRPRRFDTRLGTVYLMVPKIRKGGYVPFFVTEKKRSEQALMAMVKEAWINGVSTRKIERLAKELGIENVSASQVSQINKGLDEQIEVFRNRLYRISIPLFGWMRCMRRSETKRAAWSPPPSWSPTA